GRPGAAGGAAGRPRARCGAGGGGAGGGTGRAGAAHRQAREGSPHQPRAARRRHARRLHLGRAGAAAGRRPARHRQRVWHLGRRPQRRDPGARLGRGRAGRRDPGAGAAVARRGGAARAQPAPEHALREGALGLRPQPIGRLPDLRILHPRLLALPVQPLSDRVQPAADGDSGPARHRGPTARPQGGEAVHLRHQRPHGQAARLHADRGGRGRAARLRLPAQHLPRGGDRRRGLLGRRLPGQPGALAALPRGRGARHHDRADQRHPAPGTADQRLRHHEPLERDQLQRIADERDAGDRLRAAAAGGGPFGAAALPAHLPALHRRRGPDAGVQALHQAQRGLGVPAGAAALRAAGGGPFPRRALRQHRAGKHAGHQAVPL
ncbi:MAG: Ferredoxin reductase, partial [uncultured Acetobacteraceae bacterium]